MQSPETISQEDKIVAALIYGSSFLTAFLGPLIIWLIKKNSSEFVDYHGREYLNFFFSYTVYTIIGSLLTIVMIGFLIVPIVALLAFIFTIVALLKALKGDEYEIPFVFRIL